MEHVVSVEEVRTALARPRLEGRTIGFVPTMGALHEGHLSLVRASRERCDLTVVSVFVNPTQFVAGEDFEAYPRDLAADEALLAAEGVELLFAPTEAVMYPRGSVTAVDPGPLGGMFEGKSRPGHFTGVATVVTKLFSIVRPDVAFFGEKDYQQLRIIERVSADLDLGVRVVGCPIVRSAHGLALSSRNAYLSEEERGHALVLSRALEHAREAAAGGETSAIAIAQRLGEEIAAEPGVTLDYAVVVDAHTLEAVESIDCECRALVAARVGKARLIDNGPVSPPSQS
jgi:pantoate--beta-alanine ligase